MRRDNNTAIDGQAYALNVLTPISPGREAELRDLLAALPGAAHSPFARLPGTTAAPAAPAPRPQPVGAREAT
jgi:hypothetical protein